MSDMMHRAKHGFSAIHLIGIIYSGLGGLFTVMGALFLFLLPREVIMIGLIFGGVGLLFLILGIVFLISEARKRRTADEMISANRYVWGEVTDWAENMTVRINHIHPGYLIVRYSDPMGQAYIFKSRNLPVGQAMSMVGKSVKVYYKDSSFRNYYIDV